MSFGKSGVVPFCTPYIGSEEIDEVVETLKSGWITTGPKCREFEDSLKEYLGCKSGVAVSSCTAALHLALAAHGIGPGDEVITSPITFPATVNTILHVGATPVLADVLADSANIDPLEVMKKVTTKTKAIIPVHLAGLPCDMDSIAQIAHDGSLAVIEDAAHALGSRYRGNLIGADSTSACFSFYPIKNITTIEGGFVSVRDLELAERIRCYSLHGLTKNAWNRYETGRDWFYDVIYPGYKYNMSDVQASVGLHQLRRLEDFLEIRAKYAKLYREILQINPHITLPPEDANSTHSYHLFVIRVNPSSSLARDELIVRLAENRIGTSVHFIPIPCHSYYRSLGFDIMEFPNALDYYRRCISLPLYPRMDEDAVVFVAETINRLLQY